MTITPIGFFIIAIGIVAVMLPSRTTILYLTIFFMPFTATAVVNFPGPSFGLQPGYFLGMLLMARYVLEWLFSRTRQRLTHLQRMTLMPFVFFVFVAGLSILLIPFREYVYVRRPSGDYQLLRLSMENFTQFGYLVYVVFLTISIAACKLEPNEIRRAIRVLIASSIFVALWGWAQLYMYYAGIPYPEYIFNNSLSFLQKYGQKIRLLGFKRMNSVAPEPSMFARFLLMPTFLCFYYVYNKAGSVMKPKTALWLAIFFAITLIFTSTSTALVGLAGSLLLFLLYILSKRGRISVRIYTVRESLRTLFVVVLGFAGLPLALYSLATFALGLTTDQIIQFIEILLIDKADSESGGTRLDGALQGLSLFAANPLFGVGWGSNRTFDLLTNILSTTGLVGMLTFFLGNWLLARRTAWLSKRFIQNNLMTLSEYPKALFFALVVRLFGKFLSEPDILYLDHWLLVGLIVATLRWTNLNFETLVPKTRQSDREIPQNGRVHEAAVV
ncbi:MAG: O-antigen ligase family protein [candidate division KSB1 bacterium]|nr:O-antigen ligase family protein [candidate division KSB1 bacterium]MDZ7367396.1 O-antigen ligase family protein [candidate division KSB1 bacterium]MDZ7405277.1 O-antigen ligase family protein [candidate division KSB1 bacterium]